MPDVSAEHSMKVGETATANVDGHPARTDSPEFLHAKAAAHKIIATLGDVFQGEGAYQMHHGGSLWLNDGNGWFLVLNEAGIEWSSQFCADPAKIDALRANAERVYAGFPKSESELTALGYPDTHLMHDKITDAAGVGKWTDSSSALRTAQKRNASSWISSRRGRRCTRARRSRSRLRASPTR